MKAGPDETSILVGSRIESDGSYATVKFVGEVPDTKGKDFREWTLIFVRLENLKFHIILYLLHQPQTF